MSFPGPAQPTLLQRLWSPVVQAGLDMFFPRLCCFCKVPVVAETDSGNRAEAWFCPPCSQDIPWIEGPRCQVCGELYSGSFSHDFRCMNCSGRRLGFDFAVAACRADGVVRELVHKYKYEGHLRLRSPLAYLLQQTLEDPRLSLEDLGQWLLVPVPLHPDREHEREYNQSWELCVRLSQNTGIQAVKALARVRETTSQAGLHRKARLRNLSGAFALSQTRPWRKIPPLAGRSVLLVDDVFTTGATTSECAQVLRRVAGVQKVVVITVARG